VSFEVRDALLQVRHLLLQIGEGIDGQKRPPRVHAQCIRNRKQTAHNAASRRLKRPHRGQSLCAFAKRHADTQSGLQNRWGAGASGRSRRRHVRQCRRLRLFACAQGAEQKRRGRPIEPK
jgi:hypothetical protein